MKIHLPAKEIPKIEWALLYARLGWPVLPLHFPLVGGTCSCGKRCSSPAKHPLSKHGVKDATRDISQIRNWWTSWPTANIGIATGLKSNLLVIDIDPKHGGSESLLKLEREHGEIPTQKVATGGKGEHLYFKYPGSLQVKNRVHILPGVDVRSNDGYVVAPPSVHASGQGYIWQGNQIISETPSWLLSFLNSENNTPIPKGEQQSKSEEKIGEGGRNNFLASIAGSLRRHGLGEHSICKELQYLNRRLCSPSLENEEVKKISKSISNYEPAIIWGDLKEIPEEKYVIPNMDESFLPRLLQPWVADISERMQVPIEFVAAPAIVAISSLVGRKIGLFPKQNDNWLVVPNLWGAVVARPGFFKSPTIAEALKPLEKIISSANQEFESKRHIWELEKNINEAAIEATKDQLIKAIKKGQDVDIESLRGRMRCLKEDIDRLKPIAKRYKTNDSTVEKIASLLQENPVGMLVIRDELYGWLASMNKNGREGDREFYLESWNGYGSYTIDRIGRGTTHISSLCLSIFGGIQPSKLEKYVLSTIGENDDGLLQRFQILLYPEILKEWKNYDVCPNVQAVEQVDRLFQKIADIPELKTIRGTRFSIEAQEIFNDWRESLELTLRSKSIDSSSYESHLAKYRSLLPSLALLFELVDHSENTFDEFIVSKASIELAIKWCHFLNLHARKIYKVSSSPELASARALAKKITERKIKDGDSVRSIYRHNWSYLNDPENVQNGLKSLEKLSWIKLVKTEGKRSQTVRLNPEL